MITIEIKVTKTTPQEVDQYGKIKKLEETIRVFHNTIANADAALAVGTVESMIPMIRDLTGARK